MVGCAGEAEEVGGEALVEADEEVDALAVVLRGVEGMDGTKAEDTENGFT